LLFCNFPLVLFLPSYSPFLHVPFNLRHPQICISLLWICPYHFIIFIYILLHKLLASNMSHIPTLWFCLSQMFPCYEYVLIISLYLFTFYFTNSWLQICLIFPHLWFSLSQMFPCVQSRLLTDQNIEFTNVISIELMWQKCCLPKLNKWFLAEYCIPCYIKCK
jgi:hypothetical protein